VLLCCLESGKELKVDEWHNVGRHSWKLESGKELKENIQHQAEAFIQMFRWNPERN